MRDYMSDYVKVKNLVGTGENTPPTGHKCWLDFWYSKNNDTATRLYGGGCKNRDCNSRAVLGAHLKLEGETSKQYIVPLCDSCNKITQTFEVPRSELVPVIES